MEPSKFKFNLQETADPRTLNLLEKINASLVSLFSSVKSIKIDLPQVFQIKGNVSVDRISQMPPVSVSNWTEVRPYFQALDQGLLDLQAALTKSIESLKTTEKEGPEDVTVSAPVQIADFSELLDGIEELKKGFNLLLKKDYGTISTPDIQKVEMTNFRQLVPQPVTNININALRGVCLATAVTVSTSLTPLPATPLANRRTLIFYNNDVTNTVYFGGANVTSSTGMPVAPGTYSPPIDAGVLMIVYAITASSTANIRVIEVSNDNIGT